MYIWTLALAVEEQLDPILLKAMRQCLSDEELTRADRFKYPQDRNRFIAAHALCRSMLSEYGAPSPSDWLFDREPLGRPFIYSSQNPHRLEFNLSHTQGMVGCVVAKGQRVSIDLESRTRQAEIIALSEKKFSRMEADDVIQAPAETQRARFFEYWTLKEAYIKVTGKGLSESLASFSFDLSGDIPRCNLYGGTDPGYEFGQFDVDGNYQGAWAASTEGFRPEPEFRALSLEDLVDNL